MVVLMSVSVAGFLIDMVVVMGGCCGVRGGFHYGLVVVAGNFVVGQVHGSGRGLLWWWGWVSLRVVVEGC